MWYPLIRSILFRLDAERSHELTISVLKILSHYPKLINLFKKPNINKSSVQCFGLKFPNRIGLAAGLDKNGECLNAWRAMGFGFIEIGTVTPKPQTGNPRPRLFRLPRHLAIINRMGFNSKGVDSLIEEVQRFTLDCPLGINIGKNRDTPLNRAVDDYLVCFQKVYDYADYITINLSSPNTPGLKSLQQGESLKSILGSLKQEQERQSQVKGKKVPLLVKISPDLETEQLKEIVDNLIEFKVEGIIATNTTIRREGIMGIHSQEEGGLSGKPLFNSSTQSVRLISQQAGDALPIIAVGGILNAQSAKEKFESGASLIQLYTGLIYKGPRLIKEILTS